MRGKCEERMQSGILHVLVAWLTTVSFQASLHNPTKSNVEYQQNVISILFVPELQKEVFIQKYVDCNPKRCNYVCICSYVCSLAGRGDHIFCRIDCKAVDLQIHPCFVRLKRGNLSLSKQKYNMTERMKAADNL